MKALPCDLLGQVILRPRGRYIYSTLTYIYINTRTYTHKACIHLERNQKWKEGACRANGYVSLTTSATLRSCYSVLTNGLWSFPALFVFLHFPPEPYICWRSILFGANVCQKSAEWFELPAPVLHCWRAIVFFLTPLQACVQFFFLCLVSIYLLLINVVSSLHLKLCSFLMH